MDGKPSLSWFQPNWNHLHRTTVAPSATSQSSGQPTNIGHFRPNRLESEIGPLGQIVGLIETFPIPKAPSSSEKFGLFRPPENSSIAGILGFCRTFSGHFTSQAIQGFEALVALSLTQLDSCQLDHHSAAGVDLKFGGRRLAWQFPANPSRIWRRRFGTAWCTRRYLRFDVRFVEIRHVWYFPFAGILTRSRRNFVLTFLRFRVRYTCRWWKTGKLPRFGVFTATG